MRSDVSLNAFSALPPHIAEGILMGQEANRVQDPVSGVRQFRGFEECNARIARQIDHAEILRANAPLDSSSRKVIEEIAERIPAIEETTGLTGWNLNRAKLIVQAIGVAACRPEGSEAAAGIVLEGRLHGHPLPPTGRPKHSVDALKQSTQLLKIYRHDPEAAGTMAERQVIGFHGTRSGTLPSILKYGLLSGRDARSHPQIAVHSGERMWSPPNGQPGVHFAQWRTPKTIAAYTKEEPPITIPSLEARRDAMVEFAAEYRTLFGPEHPWVRNGLTEVADIRAGIELLNKKPDSLESRLLRANYPIAIGTDTIGLPVYDLTYDYRKAHPKPKKEDPWPPGVAMSILSDVQDEFVIYGQIDRDRLAVMAVPPERKREVTALTRWVGISCKIIDLAALTEK